MTSLCCKREIKHYYIEDREIYCPLCKWTFTGPERLQILKYCFYVVPENYVPDSDIIPDLLEEEEKRQEKIRLKHQRYELKKKYKLLINLTT